MTAQPKIQNNNGCNCQYEAGNGHSFVCPLYEEFKHGYILGRNCNCGSCRQRETPAPQKECKCEVGKRKQNEENCNLHFPAPQLEKEESWIEEFDKEFPPVETFEPENHFDNGTETANKVKSFIQSALAKERNEAQKQGEKDGWKQGEMHGIALGKKEERQFILNVLDGIDVADKQMGYKGGGTKATRFALKSRII